METFTNWMFYLTGIVALLCLIFITFEKNIKRLNIFYLIFALMIMLLLFMLKTPALAALQGLLFGFAAYFILNLVTETAGKKDKKAFVFNYKTITSPLLAFVFAFIMCPFILYTFGSYKTQNPHGAFDFIQLFFKVDSFGIILALVLLIAVLTGIASIFGLKNVYRKIKNFKKGEESEC